MLRTLFFLAGLIIIASSFACMQSTQFPRGAVNTVLTPPKLLHVYNGTSLGFYTSTGAYGFGTLAKSVFSAAYGNAAQMVQHTVLGGGTFYIGASCASCATVTYFNGYAGGYKFSAEAVSKFTVFTGNKSQGIALNNRQNILYATDTTNKGITFFNSQTGGYGAGGTSGFSFAGPPLSLQYLTVDSLNDLLVATDPTGGRVYFMDGVTGADLGSTLINGACAGYTTLGHAITSDSLHISYVICKGTNARVVLISTTTQAVLATVNVPTITTATDLTYNTTNGKIIVVGGTKAISMNAADGSGFVTFDTNTAPCNVATATLSAAVYDSASSTIFVSDSTNSVIYKIDAATMTWKDITSCTNSSFSVAADLSAPTRIGFF
ncbi:MAG: hypothetical protein SGI74_00175 [Oligoflexia bacterium]|nr:hypothetical protein [Oligoflexia bacterium]